MRIFEGAGGGQPGEKGAPGRTDHSLQEPDTRVEPGGDQAPR